MSGDASAPLKPQLAISITQAQSIVDRVGSGQLVTGVTELRGGAISAVFEITVSGAPPHILKVYPTSLHWKMAKEVHVLGLLRNISAPVPRILSADDKGSLIDFSFVLMTRLDGTPLRELEPNLNEAQLFSIYAEMGARLHEIHRIEIETFGYIGTDGVWKCHATNRAYMSFQFDKKLSEFHERGGDVVLGKKLETAISTREDMLGGCTAACLCHFDFHSGNILAASKDGVLGISGILDFESAIAGDPVMDIAKALYYFTPKDEPKRAGLLAGYGALPRSDFSETLDLYHLYCTLELWCWMAQIGSRDALPGLTNELEQQLQFRLR
jgi:aminoglycoside phosphotransferase (APT) family kinase protein